MSTIWERQRNARLHRLSFFLSFCACLFLRLLVCLSPLPNLTRGGDIVDGFPSLDIVLPCAFSLAYMIAFCLLGWSDTDVCAAARAILSPRYGSRFQACASSNCRVPQTCQLNQSINVERLYSIFARAGASWLGKFVINLYSVSNTN
jgi:hypothetical protein